MLAKRIQSVIAVSAVLALASGVRADLVPTTSATGASSLPPAVQGSATLPAAQASGGESLSTQLMDELLAGVLSRTGRPAPAQSVRHAALAEASDGAVFVLPPGPSSAQLLLFALGGLGAWHLGRSARQLHIAALPEWYHAGGPTQIGNATPLELDFSRSAMPLCRFESTDGVAADRPAPPWLRPPEPRYPFSPRHLLVIAAPRGPPAVCC